MIDINNFNLNNVHVQDNIASVTTILSILEDDDYIRQMKLFMNQDKLLKMKNNAQLRGTIIHEKIGNYFNNKDNEIILSDEKLRRYMIGAEYFIQKYCTNYEPLYIEKQFISHELKYYGTPDAIVKNKLDNSIILMDYKTSSNNTLGDKLLQKYKMQLVAYKYLFEHCTNKEYIIDKLNIIIFTNKKSTGFNCIITIDNNEIDDLYKQFNTVKDQFYFIYNKFKYES